jgi:hypothetical protein
MFVSQFLPVGAFCFAIFGIFSSSSPVENPQQAMSIDGEYVVSVDYSQSFEQMVKAGGYDQVSPDITPGHFPVKGEGKKEVKIRLIIFNSSVSSDTAIKMMADSGYRPAKFEELCALGAQYPDLQNDYAIIALGTIWPFHRVSQFVPSIRRNNLGRCMDTSEWESAWGSYCRLAAVKEK